MTAGDLVRSMRPASRAGDALREADTPTLSDPIPG